MTEDPKTISLGETNLSLGIVGVLRYGERESQVLHIAFVAAEEHQVPVQLGVQCGQIVELCAPLQQLLEEEQSQRQLQDDPLANSTTRCSHSQHTCI